MAQNSAVTLCEGQKSI